MPNGDTLGDVFGLIRSEGEKRDAQHLVVIERLTVLETKQVTQPCEAVKRIGDELRTHVDQTATTKQGMQNKAFDLLKIATAAFIGLAGGRWLR